MDTGMLVSVGYIVVLLVVFYFFAIRPQKKRDKQTKDMINAIQVGDDVLTIGGIRGTVARIKDDRFFIESSNQDKTVLEIEKWAIKDVIKYVEDK